MPILMFGYVPPLSPALKAYLEAHTNPMAHTFGIVGATTICCLTLALALLAFVEWQSAPVVKQPRYNRIPGIVRAQNWLSYSYIFLIAVVGLIYYQINRSSLKPAYILFGTFLLYFAITVVLIVQKQSFQSSRRSWKIRVQTGKRGVELAFLSYFIIAIFTLMYFLFDLAMIAG